LLLVAVAYVLIGFLPWRPYPHLVLGIAGGIYLLARRRRTNAKPYVEEDRYVYDASSY
jgi:hypothetical protein